MNTTDALRYHESQPAGKIGIQLTKPCRTQQDLALAYTPGVAIPVKKIFQHPSYANRYTNRGNLVGVITNGTAVLGLGNMGPLASKPVMEGKAVLFKRFAGIDAFDIELNVTDPEALITTVEHLAPTFGGINLEDIAAPDCFRIEDELIQRLSIPVFHDDQHGTAIISGAALLNALELVGKNSKAAKVVVVGAGAAGIRCAQYYIELGIQLHNLCLVDSKGVIHSGRKDLDIQKQSLASTTVKRTLADALQGADVVVGVSTGNIISPAMIRTMAERPIIFALANPDPEISYNKALQARPDSIVATGRSDYPNQINNVLGFPFMFRGALDVQATTMTPHMKRAATLALADLAHTPVPRSVLRAYGLKRLQFGNDYIVPKPFDSRALVEVSLAVAQAAMQDGIAQRKITLRRYRQHLTHLASSLI